MVEQSVDTFAASYAEARRSKRRFAPIVEAARLGAVSLGCVVGIFLLVMAAPFVIAAALLLGAALGLRNPTHWRAVDHCDRNGQAVGRPDRFRRT